MIDSDAILQQLTSDMKKATVTDIAKKTGLAYPTIQNIMTGKNKNPTIKTLEKIRKALDQL